MRGGHCRHGREAHLPGNPVCDVRPVGEAEEDNWSVASDSESDVASSILNVTFDCSNGELVARFWSEVTGWSGAKAEMPGNSYWLVGPGGDAAPRLVFVEVPEPKRVKNSVHLDLLPRDGSQDQEITRIESLGGRVIDDRREVSPGGWVVMADPEGNEFCIESGE